MSSAKQKLIFRIFFLFAYFEMYVKHFTMSCALQPSDMTTTIYVRNCLLVAILKTIYVNG
jgi:hypothetical protein